MSLELELVCFVAVLAATILTSWYVGGGSCGLSIAYLISLGFIHFWGGLIHTLPWYFGGDTEFTALGFDQFTWAITFFAVGRCLITPLVCRKIHMRAPARDVPALASMCLIGGVILYGFLRTLLSGIPSVSALTTCGGALVLAGLCLFTWSALQQRRYAPVICVLMSLSLLPFFTIVSAGFLGYGAGAALVVIAFLSCFLHSRLMGLLLLIGTLYGGACIFMTYMRDRDDIRYEVWEEESSLGQRISRIKTTFTNIEALDLTEQDQLDRIEARLNQNDLVGRAVSNLESGEVYFARGETLRQALISLVPRIFWPSKPVTAGSPNIVSYYTGLAFGEGTSVGIGQVMEGYVNFGTAGVIGVFLVFGVAIGVIDWIAAQKLHRRDTLGFITWFVPGIAFLQPGGSLVEVAASVAASIVLVWLVRIPVAMRLRRVAADEDLASDEAWAPAKYDSATK